MRRKAVIAMSQLILTAVGGDLGETVSLTAEPDVRLGPDDLLIEVEAAPVNNADLLFAAGYFAVYPQVPQSLGAEGVGRVVRAGDSVGPDLVGQRVLILPTFVQGTWADQVVVPAAHTVTLTTGPVAAQADVRQLAMLPVNPATAYALLHDYVELGAGDWIAVNMANSAVGQYLVALAKRTGIKTAAVVRREAAAEQVRALGADLVVVDGDDLGDRLAKGLDGGQLRLALDGTGDPGQVAALVQSLEPDGTVVAYSAATGQAPVVPLGDLLFRGIRLRGFFILNWLRDTPREKLEQIYGELATLAGQGILRASVEAEYPLADYRDALAHAARDGRSGKILFVPDRG
jgi:NADPH:quinone reductase-like Zn-dependent oxidoreductase